jgi:hypothetical protein
VLLPIQIKKLKMIKLKAKLLKCKFDSGTCDQHERNKGHNKEDVEVIYWNRGNEAEKMQEVRRVENR